MKHGGLETLRFHPLGGGLTWFNYEEISLSRDSMGIGNSWGYSVIKHDN